MKGAQPAGGLPIAQLRSALKPLQRGDWSLRVGRVVRVDAENMLVDVRFEDSPGGRIEVPILAAGASQRALMLTVPEENSLVVVGFATYYGTTMSSPYIVGYLPLYRGQLNYKPFKAQSSGQAKVRRYRGRKLYPGDVYMSSAQGSELKLDWDILLEGPSFDTVKLREEDGAIISRSLNRYHADTAIRTWSGLVTRNDFEVLPPGLDIKPEGLEGPQGEITASGLPYIRTSTGRKFYHSTITGKNIDEDGDTPFVEFRVSVEEISDAVRPVTQELHDFDLQISNPVWRSDSHQLMELNVGTLVGDDPIYEKTRYGKVLVPHLFQSSYLFEGDEGDLDKPNVYDKSYVEGGGWTEDPNYLFEEALSLVADVPQKFGTAAAVRFRMRNEKSGMTYFALTKEGKAILHLNRSSVLDPLGAGRSLELATEGSVKAVIGRNDDWHHSVFGATRGSVVLHVGSTGDQRNTRERQKALYVDGAFYGQHGYHDFNQICQDAPIAGSTANSNAEIEGMSADLIVDKNIHAIVGSDGASGDKKSVTLDTEGSVVAAVGKDSHGHSMVLQLDGSLEGQFGVNDADARSINLGCAGGVQVHVSDGDSHLGQSVHIEMAKGLHVVINGPDDEGGAFNLDVRGNVRIRAQGETIQASLVASQQITTREQAPDIRRVLVGNVSEIVTGNLTSYVMGNRTFVTTGSKV